MKGSGEWKRLVFHAMRVAVVSSAVLCVVSLCVVVVRLLVSYRLTGRYLNFLSGKSYGSDAPDAPDAPFDFVVKD